MGLTTALLSIGLLLWQQSRARSESTNQMMGRKAQRMGRKAGKASGKASKRASDAMSDIDWQARLAQLKEMWNPTRLELEKVQISKK
jgi:hypothetical protein